MMTVTLLTLGFRFSKTGDGNLSSPPGDMNFHSKDSSIP